MAQTNFVCSDGALCLYAITPLTISMIDEWSMYRNFPLLGDFSSPLEVRRWQGDVEIVDLMSSGGKQKVLKVSLGTTHYSGFPLSYFPRDWSGYRRLQLKLFNPLQSPLKLTIRIHDSQHYGLGQGDYYGNLK